MRLLAIIEYDGTDFIGFQVQAHGRTVQGELERVLEQITGVKTRVTGAGRTDTGVHASGQGVHLDTAWAKPLAILQRALNAELPNDIAVRSLAEVPADFSARYSAVSRAYRYTILNQAQRAPLRERYALRVSEPLDSEAMHAAAQVLLGTQDFGAFGTPPRGGSNTVRTVLRANVTRVGDLVQFEIEADAFLYRMVRRITSALIRVGTGAWSAAEFRAVLAQHQRAPIAALPHGLCLIAVKYGEKDENI